MRRLVNGVVLLRGCFVVDVVLLDAVLLHVVLVWTLYWCGCYVVVDVVCRECHQRQQLPPMQAGRQNTRRQSNVQSDARDIKSRIG